MGRHVAVRVPSMRYAMSRIERLEDYLLYNDTELLEKLKHVSLAEIHEQRKDVVKAQCPPHATAWHQSRVFLSMWIAV